MLGTSVQTTAGVVEAALTQLATTEFKLSLQVRLQGS